jgi:hypothetical protein
VFPMEEHDAIPYNVVFPSQFVHLLIQYQQHSEAKSRARERQTSQRKILSNEGGGHTYSSGLDLETKIFSASGRGGAFFLTSLFIELIDLTHPAPRAGGRGPGQNQPQPRSRSVVGGVGIFTASISIPPCG